MRLAENRCVVVFDLDGTLTWRDTYVSYLIGFLIRHPSRFLRTVHLPWFVLRFYLGRITNTELKQEFLRACLGGLERSALEKWTKTFLDELLAGGFVGGGLKTLEHHRRQGDILVLMTASLDLYADEVGNQLGFHHVICSNAEWLGDRLSGRLSSPNRYGEEKVRCLRTLKKQYPEHTVIAYADHYSDIPLLRAADQGFLVNGAARSRRLARQAGISQKVWGV